MAAWLRTWIGFNPYRTNRRYPYDTANRLDYYYEDGAQTDLTWDNNGNLLTQGTSVYTWDAANRLVSADVGGVVSSFAYNGLGQRTSQTVGGVTTEYVLDVATGLPEVIVATSGGASTYYVQVSGQILAQYGSGAWAYALPDHLGSVRQLTNAGGQVTLAQSYDPFGNLFEAAGAGASGFGYTGELWDAEAELLHLRARYYDPLVGRFVSQDPWPGTSTHPETLHGYMYAANNPIIHTDPSGLDYIPELDRYTCDDPHKEGGYVWHVDRATGYVDRWPCIVDPANVQMNPNPYRDGTKVPIPPGAPGYEYPTDVGPRPSRGWGPIDVCNPTRPDDELWKYRPECWAPIPTVEEAAEQVAESFSNTPFSGVDGFAVGGSLAAQGPWSGCVPNATTGGTEIVYDFFHQQRGSFSYSGAGSRFATSLLAAGATGYVGSLEGFSRWPNEVGVRAYRGFSLSLSGSGDVFSAEFLDAVSAGPSAGGIFAATYSPHTGGFDPQGIRGFYLSASVGGQIGVPGVSAPVAVETYLTEYQIMGEPKRYSGGFGDTKTNRMLGAARMIADMRVHGWGNFETDRLALQWAIRGAR